MNDVQNQNQDMSEWDKAVCKHLDDLWKKHHSGQIDVVSLDEVFAEAYERTRKAQKEHRAELEKNSSIYQSSEYVAV